MNNRGRVSYLARKLLCAALGILVVLSSLLSFSSPAWALPQGQEVSVNEADNTFAAEVASNTSWPMVGANPQRTSWNAEEVRGKLNPVWYRVIEPYIPSYVQIIAANGLLYVATARGLYALDAATGATAWVYPTELPLGNSPTIHNGVAYVGGHDRRLHAINAQTGAGIWTFQAGSGFDTNPLVIDINGRPVIYAGNRDGSMYAVEDRGGSASLLWKYETQGPITFSAAYRDNTIYFASNDSHAYALNAQNGGLVWKTSKLPGAGFQFWWPVIYTNPANGADVVMLAGSNNYRHYLSPGYGADLQFREMDDIFPNRLNEAKGTLLGSRNPDGTVNAARSLMYFEAKPWRRTSFVLNRQTGHEVTFDFDADGKPEYAPILWHGTHSGNRYPAVLGSDGILYQSNTYMSDDWILGGQVSGWPFGTPLITTPSAKWIAMDEALAYSAGGNLIYWSHCAGCSDGSAGAFDISIPNTNHYPSGPDASREWVYFDYDLDQKIPGHKELYSISNERGDAFAFQGPNANYNGVYGQNGYQNAPIPYAGRVYMHRSNAVIAFGNHTGAATQVPRAATAAAPPAGDRLTRGEIEQKLAVEVQKMINAGPLRPGHQSVGLFDSKTKSEIGDNLLDYWHNPADTLYTLVVALPYLPTDLRQSTRAYLQSLYAAFPPHQYSHIGWRDGASREPFDLPPEIAGDLVNHGPGVRSWDFDGWLWPPQMFYGLWKYAEEFGGAGAIFDASRSRLETPPSNAYLVEYPYVHNAYIAGYVGYLELEALAGRAESASVRNELNRLMALRASSFNKNTPYTDGTGARALSVARNFMYLVPELGEYLNNTIYNQVKQAVDEYSINAPYWFVSNFAATIGEGAKHHLYDYHALFQARALILQEPSTALSKYVDVPGVQVGDLFYIQNLVALLEDGTAPRLSVEASPSVADAGQSLVYTVRFSGHVGQITLTDTLPYGLSVPEILEPQGTGIWPTYDANTRQVRWSANLSGGEEIILRYRVTIATTDTAVLKNLAEVSDPSGTISTGSFTIAANALRSFLMTMRSDSYLGRPMP